MTTTYLVIAMIGIVFLLLLTLFSDLVESIFDFLWASLLFEKVPLLNPISFSTALTIFGVVGYLFATFSELNKLLVFILSVGFAIFTLFALYILITKPKEASDTSLAFSINNLVGLQADVTIPIPAKGFGEILVKLGGGNSNQIAASYDEVDIKLDDRVFIVDVKDGVVYVSILNI